MIIIKPVFGFMVSDSQVLEVPFGFLIPCLLIYIFRKMMFESFVHYYLPIMNLYIHYSIVITAKQGVSSVVVFQITTIPFI